jgi:hypothetical protein
LDVRTHRLPDLDPVVALGIAALAAKAGREAWRGEDCGC